MTKFGKKSQRCIELDVRQPKEGDSPGEESDCSLDEKGHIDVFSWSKRRDSSTHKAKDWAGQFNQISQAKDADGIRTMRMYVQKMTIKTLNDEKYQLEDGQKRTLSMETMLQNARRTMIYQYPMLHGEDLRVAPEDVVKVTEISVEESDCIDVCERLREQYPVGLIAVLNMASWKNPGGGFRKGCGAQEENLCRRSNLIDCLNNQRKKHRIAPIAYPLPRFGGAISKDVCFFRGSERDGYPFRSQPLYVDVITAAAYRLGKDDFREDGRMILEKEIDTRKKITAIMQMAAINKTEHLVLSAFGCGAFNNPPDQIAQMFKATIETYEFRSLFKTITFAIIDDHNSRGEGNVTPFKRAFNDYLKQQHF